MVFAFDIVARQARRAPPVSTEMVERALPEAEGRNVVNVILVDFRGFDTLGEITVLAAAAIGAVALARAGRRPRRASATSPRSPRRVADEAPARDLAAGTTIDLIGPSMPVIYLAVLLASVYLLVAGHNHPGAGSSAGSSPAPASPCATSPAASTRCARSPGCGRGRSSAPACWSPR